jgi:hypothetical protein
LIGEQQAKIEQQNRATAVLYAQLANKLDELMGGPGKAAAALPALAALIANRAIVEQTDGVPATLRASRERVLAWAPPKTRSA